jgi:hypothetical protein
LVRNAPLGGGAAERWSSNSFHNFEGDGERQSHARAPVRRIRCRRDRAPPMHRRAVTIGGFLLWVIVLAVTLLRRPDIQTTR